ncbi:hypothetical protein ACFFQW_13160 [Umezawaea endophytica]|uniref:Uncharacterized protein n=2 Tax=Umezawaea endophytica TaxID=1654476 RepID=A0A9X2VL92_9PSEU|nr:hypothetical protein [Umezawaea endophytica]MCS7478716.1 hypothetical protein [Umezawaea endophytica]
MEYKTGKGYQQITVCLLFGNLDYDMCVRNAGTLLERDGQDVDGRVKGSSSSPYRLATSSIGVAAGVVVTTPAAFVVHDLTARSRPRRGRRGPPT